MSQKGGKATKWTDFVKKIAAEEGIPYGQAMKRASLRKKEMKKMSGGDDMNSSSSSSSSSSPIPSPEVMAENMSPDSQSGGKKESLENQKR